MRLACLRAESVMQQRAAGLSNAAGMFLEEHLGSCARCRARANLLAGLRDLDANERPALTLEQRQRAILNALAAVDPPPSAAARPIDLGRARWLWLPALAACTIGLGFYMLHTRELKTAATSPQAQSSEPTLPIGDRVLSGEAIVAGQTWRAGTALPPSAALVSEKGATLALAHATATLADHSAIDWDAGRRQLQLIRGRVVLDVDPAPHRSFRVRTERFSVLVLGTRFEVSLEGVKLWRGAVSVLAPDGAPLARLDSDGAHEFRIDQRASTAADGGATAIATKHGTREGDAANGGATAIATKPVAPEPARLLENARARLAEGHVADARRILQRALAGTLGPEQRAEALSLRAECNLIDADYDRARDEYLRVFSRYGAIAAGQTALFAAARIEAEHGSRSNARSLFERYLARYPNGSFAKEATQRLATLR